MPALGNVKLRNLWAVAAGQSSDAIVVMAHRDDTGVGPGANDNATGTAALVELARNYAQSSGRLVRSAHTIVFLSTDGGSFGGLGAMRFVEHAPFHVVATINLDAIGGLGTPRVVITGDRPRSPAATFVETAAKRVLEQTGVAAQRATVIDQLIDLGFPFTLYEQGPFVARGIPAITLTTAGERPPDAFTDRAGRLERHPVDRDGPRRAAADRLARPGPRARAGHDELRLGRRPDRARLGDRARALHAPAPVPRRCRRPVRSLQAARHLAAAGRAQPAHAARLLAVRRGRVLRVRAVRRMADGRCATAEPNDVCRRRLAGARVARARDRRARRLGRRAPPPRAASRSRHRRSSSRARRPRCSRSPSSALLVLATNPFALLFILPALHAWLWLPQVRSGKPPARAFVLLLGLAGPALILLSLGVRYGPRLRRAVVPPRARRARVRPGPRGRDHAGWRSLRRAARGGRCGPVRARTRSPASGLPAGRCGSSSAP